MLVTEKLKIGLYENNIPLLYNVEVAEHITIGKELKVNIFTFLIKKTLIKIDDFGWLFNIELVDKKHTNPHQNTKYLEALYTIYENLLVYINTNGIIKSVVNRNSIQEDWHSLSKELLSKHKKDNFIKENIKDISKLFENEKLFLDYVKNIDFIKALFPPIKNIEVGKISSAQDSIIEPSLNIEIPIMITTQVERNKTDQNHIEAIIIAKLDEQNFDSLPIKRVLREGYKKPSMIVDINLNVFQTIEFDVYGKLIEIVDNQEIQIGPDYRYRKVTNAILKKENI